MQVGLTSHTTTATSSQTPATQIKNESSIFQFDSNQLLMKVKKKHPNAKWIPLNKLWNYSSDWSNDFLPRDLLKRTHNPYGIQNFRPRTCLTEKFPNIPPQEVKNVELYSEELYCYSRYNKQQSSC